MTALILARFYIRQTMRTKAALVFGALQPVLFLFLFGPLFARSGVGSWDVLVPGLLMQLGLLSAGMSGFGIVFDQRFGVLERLRVTPAGRVSLLLGRVLKDALVLLIQAAGLIALGYALGLRAPLPGVLLGTLLVLLLAIGLASLSYAIALTLNQDLFAPIMSTVLVPLLLLSGALLPMTLAPAWLDVLSHLTPFRYAVDALRALYAGAYTSAPALVGAAVTLAFTVLTLALATRRFHHENA
ncbi:transport permease protein [Sphaerisporangium krabiense]|uniref:Transport permease protein n=1 Tax=Sphaerisporangium krabiense TaxID=763782 RepID=A0A7W8Z7N1_9ACTN|nr:ABC transporter permease [Sphaerisporangium krabiense]MBB5628835.1 ABC-2 type transport system permease protein [Sphaerisporangium krabiense]GII60324.1 transport permease protein [Sphaerisporangium krabiense]